jgi:carbonic anhydrase
VPVEIIFDVGLGDLFVIRVAGNIVAPSLVGSMELAAEKFGPRLIVVLGHTGCGAIQATIDALEKNDQSDSQHVNAIVDQIRPAITDLVMAGSNSEDPSIVDAAVRANVRASVASLHGDSEVLQELINNDGMMVVGAEYSLETGLVDFFDNIADHS